MSSEEETHALITNSALPLPKDGCNPTVARPSILTSLGNLYILPREIRDEIYRHVCNQHNLHLWKGYYCHTSGRVNSHPWNGYYCNTSGRDNLHLLNGYYCYTFSRGKIWQGFFFPIIQASKSIREEFRAVLFHQAVFAIDHYEFGNNIQRPIPFLKEISNVRIFFRSGPAPSPMGEQLLTSSKAVPISYFSGTSIMRNTCVLHHQKCCPIWPLPVQSPVVHAISQLTGFKTVHLLFSTRAGFWLIDETPEDIRTSFYGAGTCPEYDKFVLRTSRALEPTLGPFALKSRMWKDSRRERWYQCATFHPQGGPNNKVDTLLREYSTQGEGVTLPLSTLSWTIPLDDRDNH